MDQIEKTGAVYVPRSALTFIIILCLVLLAACASAKVAESPADTTESSMPSPSSSIATEPPEAVSEDVKEEVHLSDMDIRDLFDMTADEIVDMLGQDYEVVPAGGEGAMDGYFYAGIGMSFVYDYGAHDRMHFIDCEENCDILGARAGMDFAQIQEKLGPAEVNEGFIELPEYKIYEISYIIYDHTYSFSSFSPSGTDSWLTIFKNNNEQTSASNIADVTENDIAAFFDMSRDEIIKRLGTGYKIVHTGAEGTYDGYEYSDLGLIFIFSEWDKTLDCIWCTESFDIRGANMDMDFAQVQKRLGKAPVLDTWYETPDMKAYEIDYYICGCKYEFLSFQNDGTYPILIITKIREFSPYDANVAGISIDMELAVKSALIKTEQ